MNRIFDPVEADTIRERLEAMYPPAMVEPMLHAIMRCREVEDLFAALIEGRRELTPAVIEELHSAWADWLLNDCGDVFRAEAASGECVIAARVVAEADRIEGEIELLDSEFQANLREYLAGPPQTPAVDGDEP